MHWSFTKLLCTHATKMHKLSIHQHTTAYNLFLSTLLISMEKYAHSHICSRIAGGSHWCVCVCVCVCVYVCVCVCACVHVCLLLAAFHSLLAIVNKL